MTCTRMPDVRHTSFFQSYLRRVRGEQVEQGARVLAQSGLA